jgi:hypothetical protein
MEFGEIRRYGKMLADGGEQIHPKCGELGGGHFESIPADGGLDALPRYIAGIIGAFAPPDA